MIKEEYTKRTRKELLTFHEQEGNVLIEDRIEGDGRSFLIFISKEEWIDSVVRPERDKLLRESDFLMLQDIVDDLTPAEYIEIKTYRQALRDAPNNNGVFPVKPAKVISR